MGISWREKARKKCYFASVILPIGQLKVSTKRARSGGARRERVRTLGKQQVKKHCVFWWEHMQRPSWVRRFYLYNTRLFDFYLPVS